MARQRYRLAQEPSRAREFEITVRRLADQLSFGMDASRFFGSGLEYAQSRPYVMGDPFDSIDWRVTARTGKPFVKEYDATKQTPVLLLVDTSASMCVSSLPLSKYEWAVRLAVALGLAALDRLRPVGVLGVGERDLYVAPTLSRRLVMQWAHQLREYDFGERTCLGERLRSLAAARTGRSLIIVLSDLHDPRAIDGLALLRTRHEVVVLWLEDPAESRPPAGIFRAREAESGRSFFAHGKTRYRAGESVHQELVRAGVEYLHSRTDRSLIPRLRHFLEHRKAFGH